MSTSPAVAAQSPIPATKILELDRQMAASNFGPDHPWRIALAGALAIEVEPARQTDARMGVDTIRQQAHEIESRIGNIAVLIESIFDKLDTMKCHTPADKQISAAITEYSNAVMASAKAIRSANEQILSLAGGVQ